MIKLIYDGTNDLRWRCKHFPSEDCCITLAVSIFILNARTSLGQSNLLVHRYNHLIGRVTLISLHQFDCMSNLMSCSIHLLLWILIQQVDLIIKTMIISKTLGLTCYLYYHIKIIYSKSLFLFNSQRHSLKNIWCFSLSSSCILIPFFFSYIDWLLHSWSFSNLVSFLTFDLVNYSFVSFSTHLHHFHCHSDMLDALSHARLIHGDFLSLRVTSNMPQLRKSCPVQHY